MNGNESSNEPLPSLAVYNPALLKKEDLIAQFVARRAMLDRLVEELRRGGKNGKRHHLIIGPRGSGKTMLLRRLRYAIEDDAELSSGWLPLVFPEEQYNVSRLSDLWVNCLDALSDMLERGNREDESESLDQQIDELPADDEKRRAQAALELLIGRAKREDRGLVLLFDNSDLIFDRLESDHRTIREILSASNRLLFIGAANAPIEATYNHEGAFYDFFKIHEMRGLTDKETREVIFNLARLRRAPQVIETLEREPGRIRALNLLTGGNLRTIVVLYQALAQGKDDSIRADLEQLLDQYTPLYKHRFESLSAQSQQVVDALALNWDPATAAELAEKLRMETNAVSAVLNRLDSDGVVEKVPSPPGEKMFFQIAERFFNIWYLMRASRRVRRKLIWLVEFLKMFYGAEGLYHRARRMVQEPPPEGDQSQHAELALAFARAIEKPSLRRALETEGIRSLMNCGTEDRLRLSSILDLEGEDASLKDMVGRFQSLGELGEKIEQAKDKLPPEFWEYLMTAPALSLEEKKKAFDDVAQLGSDETRQWIEKFESEARRLVELFGAEPCRELFESIRDGRMADGADVEGADAAAIAGKDPSLRVIARLFRFDRTKDEALLGQAEGILTPLVRSPHVRLSWAETLVNSEFCPGAVASIDSKKLAGALKRVGRLKGHDARTWRRIGDLQFRLGRHAEAESAYRKSIALDSDAFTSWNDLGYLLVYWKGSFDEAEAAYRKAIVLDPKSASSWFRLGHLLKTYLERYEEAEAAFTKATELAPNADLPWGFLIELLTHNLKKYEEAAAVCRKATEYHPGDACLWMNLGFLLADHLKKYEEAEMAFRKAIELNPNEPWSWVHLGRLLVRHRKNYEEGEAAFHKAIELSPNEADLWMCFGECLIPLMKYEEAVEAFLRVIELNPGRQNAWRNLGLALQFSKRYEEAETAFRKAIEHNPNDAGLRMNLGLLLEHYLERRVEAEAAYRQAIALNPSEAWPWFHLGRLFVQQPLRRHEEAEAAFRKAVELVPNEAIVWMFFGEALLRLKRYDEAEAAFRTVIELNPNSETINSAWTNLGLSLQASKRYEEAEAVYRKAIELKPNDSGRWMNLGRLLADHLKRYEEAEAAIRQAISLAPNDSGQWILLGKLLSDHLNRPDEAQEAFRKAVELNEDKAEYRQSLSWRQFLLDQDLDEAELHSRMSFALEPDILDSYCRLACIFIKRGEWDDAVVYARKFISEGDDEFHERNWPDIIRFFHDAVASGHADDVVALLDETEYGERWRPLRVALQAIAEGDSCHLLRVAPEIRRPAEEIVALLLPAGARLGSAPKPARARRTRRKKPQD